MRRISTPTRGIGLVVILSLCYVIFTAFSGGITGVTQKNGSGCTCHGSSPTGTVSVVILGPESLTAGQTETYTLVITGGPLSAAGTNIAASSGELNIVSGEGLRQQSGELTHSGPKLPNQGTVSFQFAFTAPAEPGITTLYANGNSVNLSGDPSGDQWNFALSRSITVTPVTSVAEVDVPASFALHQNYPNPFNPSTTIEFTLPHAVFAQLEVFTVSGEHVATLLEEDLPAGLHRHEFAATGLASGTYIYRLVAGSHRSTRTMTLTR